VKAFRTIALLLAGAAIFSAQTPVAHADQWDKSTKFTFSQSVQVPGAVLGPGTYVFDLLQTTSGNRDVVGVYNDNQTRLIASVLAIPDYQSVPTPGTTLTFYEEQPLGQPVAIEAWFYPGDNFGRRFLYPRSQPHMAANAAPSAPDMQPAEQPALVEPSSPASAALPEPSADDTTPLVASNDTASEPAPQSTAPTPSAPAASSETQSLPATASLLPLAGLMGVLCICAAFVLRRAVRA